MKIKKTFIRPTLALFVILLASTSLALSLAPGEESSRTLGDEDAPVIIEMYTDFECPFCARWHHDTFSLLEEKYIEKGNVRLVVKHFPLSFHTHAHDAAVAAQCAAHQGNFFEYIDVLYDNQGDLEQPDLEDYARDLGLDITEFNSCRVSDLAQGKVSTDIAEGKSRGVSGTPSFFINGEKVAGAQPFSVFANKIDAILSTTDNPTPVLGTFLDERTLGDDDAPVTIEMYTDFECPFCARWHHNTFPLLEEKYIEEGDARLVVRHLPLSFHTHAHDAAAAAQCAAHQGEFFDYIDVLYDNQGDLEQLDLEDYAQDLGLNMEKFNVCLTHEDTLQVVADDLALAQDKGAHGTPTFFVNGEKISGAQPFSVFANKINVILDTADDLAPPPLPDNGVSPSKECENGCSYHNKCLPYGTRLFGDNEESLYCSIHGTLKLQLEEGFVCQNNFECSTNHCSNSKCVDLAKKLDETNSLVGKLLDFFKSIFSST